MRGIAYRNKTYVTFDGEKDIWVHHMMQTWEEHEQRDFNFYDAHDINSARDTSSENPLKRSYENAWQIQHK
ncbi:hypothetical protein KSF_085180 [Reticulibacter mediterranei]|uniref:Uncharacterized protein n=1 Tax=Reticulibacter mediterranei TaxID=2778369 RepID=A0A8J3N7G9_9CHLR|nr:hypothetical protein KSF_085180 [Reticulibacter mediterranei]